MSALVDFGGVGPRLHFAHANGYPPLAYAPLIEHLTTHYHVVSQPARPLWPGQAPAALRSWRPFVDDLLDFLAGGDGRARWIGAGHSLGAMVTTAAALRQPELFSALVLIDPVFIPPWMQAAYSLAVPLGLGPALHPLFKGAARRRRVFLSADEMFERYRQTPVFARIDDRGLRAYIQALARPRPDGRVELAYTPEWEARVHATGPFNLWPQLKRLRPPVLVIRGQESDTFGPASERALRRRLPHAVTRVVPDAGHLVPLERPREVGEMIVEFLWTILPQS